MKARVKATGEIIEVKVYKREHRLYIRIHGEKTGEIYRAKDLDFDIDGKFAENCLNGIKQGFVHDPDYWTRLEHTYAGMAMQGMLANANHYLWERKRNYESLVANASELAHALVEKMKEERK